LVFLNEALDEEGLVAFDAADQQARDQAVRATLGVSLDLLTKDEYARYQELAIFPEDVDLPLETLHKLWAARGGLSKFGTEKLCQRLYNLSLLVDLAARTIRLHDVLRTYLRHEVSTRLTVLHTQFLAAYRYQHWAQLPPSELYLWKH